jgi:hypothetical protein
MHLVHFDLNEMSCPNNVLILVYFLICIQYIFPVIFTARFLKIAFSAIRNSFKKDNSNTI